MTTAQYRWIAMAEIVGICLLGLLSAVIILAAVPAYRCRESALDAMAFYADGSDAALRKADEALDQALAINDRLPAALMLRGRIALEQGKLGLAYDTYQKLQGVSSESLGVTGTASCGRACAMLLEAAQATPPNRSRMAEAYQQFERAIREDPFNGDAQVNAAICSLHLKRLVEAAKHLKAARSSQNMSYEAMVSYYAAVGTLLVEASGQGREVAAQVVSAFDDPDPQLRRTGRMLYRAVSELDKAHALAGGSPVASYAEIYGALARARILAWAPLKREDANALWSKLSRALRARRGAMPPALRQRIGVVLGLTYRKGEPRAKDYGLHWVREAAKEASTPASHFWVGAAMFDLARYEGGAEPRSRVEADATRHLLAAVQEISQLSLAEGFHARSMLGLATWKAGDRDAAVKHMAAALAMIQTPDAQAAVPAAQTAPFFRNFGLMRYARADLAGTVEMLRASLAAKAEQEDVKALLDKLTGSPTVEDVQLVSAPQLPASMPILSARLGSGGPVPLKKEQVSVEIAGAKVPFTVGPEGRIYALPREMLGEGRHVIRFRINAPGRTPVDIRHAFTVSLKGD